jgi:hypothetical protein
MRPSHLQVFDGLRITTEHMEHLQSALHSAVDDLRDIAGNGQVHRGFEVVSESPGTVTVMPGLAFDARGRRLVSDEPKTLAVDAGAPGTTTYVCLEYEQLATGEVEGKPTLIWDNCTAVALPALPPPDEALIVLARVTGGETGLTVESLLDEATPDVTAPASPSVSGVSSTSFAVTQGVLRLPPLPAGSQVNALLLDALNERRAAETPATGDLVIQLSEQSASTPFRVQGITCRTVLSAPAPANAEPAGEQAPGLSAHAEGEVTVSALGLLQFGLSCCSYGPQILSERGIATVPAAGMPAPEGGSQTNEPPVIVVGVDVTPEAPSDFRVFAQLLWKGPVDDASIQRLQAQPLQLSPWEVVVAWKAIGVQSA